jgi:hypothetical protein
MPAALQLVSSFLLDVAMRKYIILGLLVETQYFVFKDRNMKTRPLKMKPLCYPKMFGSIRPVTHRHIPKERRPEDSIL